MTLGASKERSEPPDPAEARSDPRSSRITRDRLVRLIIALRYAEADAAEFDEPARLAVMFSRHRLEAMLNATTGP